MRKFLLTISLFFLPVIIGGFLMDFVISNELKESPIRAFGELSVWNDIYDGKIDAEVTVHGSSRAWVHFDPVILEQGFSRSVYNLGIDGHSFPLQDFRYKELAKHNKTPKFIIYSVDILTLSKREDLYNYEQFMPYMLMDPDHYAYTSKYEGFEFWDYFVPLVRYAGHKKILKAAVSMMIESGDQKPMRIKGFKSVKKDWNDDFDKAKQAEGTMEITVVPEVTAGFKEFLDLAKERGITVILVFAPEHQDGQKFITNRNKIVSIYQQIAKSHDLLLLDYSSDPMCGDKKYFYNAMHLNSVGAELFSRKLVDDLSKTNHLHGIIRK